MLIDTVNMSTFTNINAAFVNIINKLIRKNYMVHICFPLAIVIFNFVTLCSAAVRLQNVHLSVLVVFTSILSTILKATLFLKDCFVLLKWLCGLTIVQCTVFYYSF